MLPVYNAISFQSKIEKGGRTQPWVVFVEEEEEIKPYVVKFFFKEQEDERHSVVNEVICNHLAQQFELPVAKAAFINLSEEFKMTLNGNLLSFVDERDERTKFGCEFLSGANLFNHSLNKYIIQNRVSIETVFAFDVLIRNRDRNNNKPNFLLHESSVCLIDHELGLEIDKHAINLMSEGEIDSRFTDHHIFLPYLKKAKKSLKSSYFEEFLFLLQNLKLNELNPYFKQLSDLGYDSNREQILEYLNCARDNSVKFVTSLKAITQ
jgi:hypothetical protein